MMLSDDNTIVALSTPAGRGAIAVIRLSGPRALAMALDIFVSANGRRLMSTRSHHALHGFIMDPVTHEYIDEVLVTPMLAPHSYTGEDIIEISCHGGVVPVEAVINLCVKAGARPAGPGEFTRRAFLNGRMDLAQAEAVADLIESQARAGHSAAMEQLRGRLSREISAMSEALTDCLALMEASIDFPEEEIPLPQSSHLRERIEEVRGKAEELLSTYQRGRFVKEGINTIITGKPNVGKSSLLNALLEEERAIVTPIPGTTRDSIQESMVINGIPFRLSDTAGLRATTDPVEKMGVDRTLRLLEGADLCLLVLDVSRELDRDDEMAVEAARKVKTLPVINKTDLLHRWDACKIDLPGDGERPIAVSAKEGWGLKELKEAMGRCAGAAWPGEGVVITRARHMDALARATEDLHRALEAMDRGFSYEFPASDLYQARECLNSILGINCPEDVLDRVFQQFCIGK